jgi:hypothetical protein
MIPVSLVYWVELEAPGVGFEPPWFSVLDWMNPGNSSPADPFESDKMFSFMYDACLALDS